MQCPFSKPRNGPPAGIWQLIVPGLSGGTSQRGSSGARIRAIRHPSARRSRRRCPVAERLRFRLDRARSARDRRRQDRSCSVDLARRHVPTTSPSTRTAPGQHAGSPQLPPLGGVRNEQLAIGSCSSKYASPLGSSRAGASGPAAHAADGSSRARIHASPIGVSTAVNDLLSPPNAAGPPAAEPRPSARTTRPSSDRRRGGTGGRAPGGPRADRCRVAARSTPWGLSRPPNG